MKHIDNKFAYKFYRSKAWLKCRGGYIQSVFGLCERCSSSGYIVHHKIELNIQNITDINITLNWDNLEYLCLACHNKETFGSKQDVIRDGLMFDDTGNVVICPL